MLAQVINHQGYIIYIIFKGISFPFPRMGVNAWYSTPE